MPEISKINIDNNTYDLKVMTKNVAPIIVKNYTGVYCTANNDPNGYLYFARLKPENNDWSKQIHIKFRIKADIPHLTNGSGYEESVVDYCLYNSTVLWYRALNGQSNTSYRPFYEHIVYRALQAGIQGGFGHLLGLRFYSSYSPNSSTYARSILIEILELDNCTIEFLDSMTIYSSVPGNGSTNYAGRNGFNATSQGVTRTGDANDPNYYNRTYYGSPKTHSNLYRYQLCFSMMDKEYVLPSNTANNNITKTKSLTTESFDPFGDIFFYNSETTISINDGIGYGVLYRQILADLRYSFNTGGYDAAGAGILVGRKPIYVVATPQADGSAKLADTPIVQELPTTEDGKIYIYLGICYSENYPYRVSLEPLHPIYWYKDGAIRQFFGIPKEYTLPTASSSTLGGVKIGENLDIDGAGVISAFSKVLTVNVGSVPTLPCSISDANVTENMVVLNSYLSNPGSQLDDWTITTGNGSINISGTIRGSTNIILTLIEAQRS